MVSKVSEAVEVVMREMYRMEAGRARLIKQAHSVGEEAGLHFCCFAEGRGDCGASKKYPVPIFRRI